METLGQIRLYLYANFDLFFLFTYKPLMYSKMLTYIIVYSISICRVSTFCEQQSSFHTCAEIQMHVSANSYMVACQFAAESLSPVFSRKLYTNCQHKLYICPSNYRW